MKRFTSEERNVQIVISLLKENNIKKVIASPGNKNVSLVVSMQHDPFFEIYSSVDERSAAYMACGLAAESGETVVLSCTGATASRNYLPGLTEAYYRKLPVMAITSGPSVSMIGVNLSQVMDRTIVSKDAVIFSTLLRNVKDSNDEWDCVRKMNEAIHALKKNGGGPVHINLETLGSPFFDVKDVPHVRSVSYYRTYDSFPEIEGRSVCISVGSHLKWSDELTNLVDRFCTKFHGVVAVNHSSNYKGQFQWAKSLMTSQEYYPHSHGFDLEIYIGGIEVPSVKANKTWRVNEDGEMRDLMKRTSAVFQMREEDFFKHYVKEYEAIERHDLIKVLDEEYDMALSKMPLLPFSNIWIASQLHDKLPENCVLHLGILNSFRSWNYFKVPNSVNTYCNVGGYGIDGGISTLLGASLANPERLYYGVFGDLAFFYDMNVLGNRHFGNNVRLLIINNGMGGEFKNYSHPSSFLKEQADDYVAAAGHFGSKSRTLLKHYAEDLGYQYLSAENKEEFEMCYKNFFNPKCSSSIVFEVFINQEDDSNALRLMKDIVSETSFKMKKQLKDYLRSTAIEILK